MSGLEGTFLNASFSTANFLGLGETCPALRPDGGPRTKNYQLALTEPYLFDRPITAGIDLFSRKLDYLTTQNVVGYSEVRTGASLTSGLPIGRRGFTAPLRELHLRDHRHRRPRQPRQRQRHPHEHDRAAVFAPVFSTTGGAPRAASARPSSTTPWTTRTRRARARASPLTRSSRAGPLGGTINYFRPDAEAILYIPHLRKTALGLRAEAAWITPVRLDHAPALSTSATSWAGRPRSAASTSAPWAPIDTENQALGREQVRALQRRVLLRRRGAPAAVLFFDAGQAFRRARTSTCGSSAPRPASSCASSCPCSTCRSVSSTPSTRPRLLPAEHDLQVRRGHDLLTGGHSHVSIRIAPVVLVAAPWLGLPVAHRHLGHDDPISSWPSHPQPGHGQRPHGSLLHLHSHEQPASGAREFDWRTTSRRR